MTNAENDALTQAAAQLESIVDLVRALENAPDDDSREETERAIQENALSVETRSNWQTAGKELEPAEYRIVLCTGGPHVELRGELGLHNTPTGAELLFTNWGTPLTPFNMSEDEEKAALTYAQQFFFGE